MKIVKRINKNFSFNVHKIENLNYGYDNTKISTVIISNRKRSWSISFSRYSNGVYSEGILSDCSQIFMLGGKQIKSKATITIILVITSQTLTLLRIG